jgi:hypothetical protein
VSTLDRKEYLSIINTSVKNIIPQELRASTSAKKKIQFLPAMLKTPNLHRACSQLDNHYKD